MGRFSSMFCIPTAVFCTTFPLRMTMVTIPAASPAFTYSCILSWILLSICVSKPACGLSSAAIRGSAKIASAKLTDSTRRILEPRKISDFGESCRIFMFNPFESACGWAENLDSLYPVRIAVFFQTNSERTVRICSLVASPAYGPPDTLHVQFGSQSDLLTVQALGEDE